MLKYLLLITTSLYTSSICATPSADEIMKKASSREASTYFQGIMKMTLEDKSGSKRTRVMKTFAINEEGNEKTASFFMTPAQVAGTAFLSIKTKGQDLASRWMYLPAVKKVKRIGASDSTQSFMGSDFTYADLEKANQENYNFKKLKVVSDKQGEYFVIEATAKSANEKKRSGYKKTVHYVRRDNFLITRSIFWGLDGKTTKFLKVNSFEKLNGTLIPTDTVMVTKKSGKFEHKTTMQMSQLNNSSKIPSSVFTTRSIEKGI